MGKIVLFKAAILYLLGFTLATNPVQKCTDVYTMGSIIESPFGAPTGQVFQVDSSFTGQIYRANDKADKIIESWPITNNDELATVLRMFQVYDAIGDSTRLLKPTCYFVESLRVNFVYPPFKSVYSYVAFDKDVFNNQMDQMRDALKDFHKLGFVHWNICYQFFVTIAGDPNIKLTGFSHFKNIGESFERKKGGFDIAPEVAHVKVTWPDAFKADWYSFGSAVYRLATNNVLGGNFIDNLGLDADRLQQIKDLRIEDVSTRLSFDDAPLPDNSPVLSDERQKEIKGYYLSISKDILLAVEACDKATFEKYAISSMPFKAVSEDETLGDELMYRTPLHIAAMKDCIEIVELCLNEANKWSIFERKRYLYEKDNELIPDFIQLPNGFLVGNPFKRENGMTALELAVDKKAKNTAVTLIRYQANLENNVPELFAMKTRWWDLVEEFVSTSAARSAYRTLDHKTILHVAAESGNSEFFFRIKTEFGGKFEKLLSTEEGKTLLSSAFIGQCEIIIRFLFELPEVLASINAKDSRDCPAIYYAVKHYPQAVHKLLTLGADVNVNEKDKDVGLLFLAAQNGDLKTTKLLLRFDAPLFKGNSKNALDAAAYYGHLHILEFYKSILPEPEWSSLQKQFPCILQAACEGFQVDIIYWLIVSEKFSFTISGYGFNDTVNEMTPFERVLYSYKKMKDIIEIDTHKIEQIIAIFIDNGINPNSFWHKSEFDDFMDGHFAYKLDQLIGLIPESDDEWDDHAANKMTEILQSGISIYSEVTVEFDGDPEMYPIKRAILKGCPQAIALLIQARSNVPVSIKDIYLAEEIALNKKGVDNSYQVLAELMVNWNSSGYEQLKTVQESSILNHEVNEIVFDIIMSRIFMLNPKTVGISGLLQKNGRSGDSAVSYFDLRKITESELKKRLELILTPYFRPIAGKTDAILKTIDKAVHDVDSNFGRGTPIKIMEHFLWDFAVEILRAQIGLGILYFEPYVKMLEGELKSNPLKVIEALKKFKEIQEKYKDVLVKHDCRDKIEKMNELDLDHNKLSKYIEDNCMEQPSTQKDTDASAQAAIKSEAAFHSLIRNACEKLKESPIIRWSFVGTIPLDYEPGLNSSDVDAMICHSSSSGTYSHFIISDYQFFPTMIECYKHKTYIFDELVKKK